MDQSEETKRRIIEALDRILASKELDEVSVVELCSACGIGRSTFYRYFESISDVVTEFFSMALQRAILSELGYIDFKGEHRHTLELLASRKNLFIKSLATRRFAANYHEMFAAGNVIFRNRYTRLYGATIDEKTDLALHYYGYVVLEVYLRWIQDGMVVPIDQVVEVLYEFFPSKLKQHVRL